MRCAVLALLAIALGGCASTRGATGRAIETAAPGVDSVTIALWHFDETGGTRAADAGPLHLDGRSGLDSRTDFGRFRNARLFTRSIDSFALVPYHPALDPIQGFTLEAWLQPTAFGPYEMTPVAAQWTMQANEQSWIFAVMGHDTPAAFSSLPSPNLLRPYVGSGREGQLAFIFQPDEAGNVRVFYSSAVLELNRWTHVAVTFDGTVVRFYFDGQLDSQYAVRGRIRGSRVPLLLANFFDYRWLSDFGGDLRVTTGFDSNPYYAYSGLIDELRLSSVARPDFPYARYRYEHGR
jgi:hypothetical protein